MTEKEWRKLHAGHDVEKVLTFEPGDKAAPPYILYSVNCKDCRATLITRSAD